MTILRIDIIEIAIEKLSDGRGINKLRISQIEKNLKYKNPLLYSDVSYKKIRLEFVKMFPIYKNKKKKTKIFKISKAQSLKVIKNYNYNIKKNIKS